jgi:molecular chaperone GrpE
MAETEAPKGSEAQAPSAGETPPTLSSPPDRASPASNEEEWESRYRYLLAEFDNFRKRTEREREQARRETRALVLRQLLPLHDAFVKAEDAARELPSEDPLRRGMELLFREWERFLAGDRFQPVARLGEPFRPEEEEAVGEIPSRDLWKDGTVAEVVQQGYRSPGGLLRPAKVIIVRARPDPSSSDGPKSSTGVPTDEPNTEG